MRSVASMLAHLVALLTLTCALEDASSDFFLHNSTMTGDLLSKHKSKVSEAPRFQIELVKSPYSGAMRGDIALESLHVTMVIDTMASNLFVFDKPAIKKHHSCFFETVSGPKGEAPVHYFRASTNGIYAEDSENSEEEQGVQEEEDRGKQK